MFLLAWDIKGAHVEGVMSLKMWAWLTECK